MSASMYLTSSESNISLAMSSSASMVMARQVPILTGRAFVERERPSILRLPTFALLTLSIHFVWWLVMASSPTVLLYTTMKLLAMMFAASGLETGAAMRPCPRRGLGAASETVRARKPRMKASNLAAMVEVADVVKQTQVSDSPVEIKKTNRLG